MRLHLSAFLISFAIAAQAQAAALGQDSMRRATESFLLAQSAGAPGQVSIEIINLPETDRYAACQKWQAFLPEGARAWGRVSVGLRCVEGGNFSLYVSARVRIDGSYVVAARTITNGQTITADDIKTVQGELTAQTANLLLNESDAIGRIARATISAERPLQATLLRSEALIQAGQIVKVITQGNGFTVSNEGQALATASAGQPVRVRLANGNVVSAIARSQGLVEVRN